MAPRTMRLGDLLIRAGVVTPEQLKQALNQQERWGGKLGTILVRMGALSEDLLVKALSRQLNIPRADLAAINIPPPLRSRLTKEVCEEYNVIPVRYDADKRAVMLAVSDPFNLVVIDDLSRRINLKIEPQLAGEQQIVAAIKQHYGEGVSGSDENLRLLNNQNSTLIKRREDIQPRQTQPPVRAAEPQGVFIDTRPPALAMSSPPMAAGGENGARVQELEKLAQKQSKAVRAVLELLIEKGVLTREEYAAWVSRR